ncbi:MAG TPA: SDR family oxidoreductase [Candidatus Sulfopaludibacter sp.]|jgi:NAD(P)-dependent dehydrogenase (short-subunit alcohol dehydrogenase family)|nr:SDR family oxidoreductase [Candidatus Sulfopaludibacter sp.]
MQGKALIITGSTGIAAATAKLAAEAGARLVIAAGDPDSAWELAAATGAECWVGELSLVNSAESVLAACVARYGRVDALFNAAGLSGRRFGDGPVHECSDEGWDVTLQHNLRTSFQMCRAVIGRMLEQEPEPDGIRGSILNMGSVLAEAPEPRHFATHAYAAAKGGVVAMSRSMAAYYAPHKIRVNVLAPALVRTPASERSQASAGLLDFLEKKQPLSGGMVDAADVARAALFLLGPDSRFITGDVLTVDAGWSVTGV